MKLFGNFEAVKFPEENLILITHNEYLYYIYNTGYDIWKKHKNAGNDHITVGNYPDVSEKELKKVLGGKFPQKETDFMRFCDPSELNADDLFILIKEDYLNYMSDDEIYYSVDKFLSKSNICYKSYLKLKDLFDKAKADNQDSAQVLVQIKELTADIIGKDIFKKEIDIIDGPHCYSCFWIMPVRVIDFSDTNGIDNVAGMNRAEITIEEDNVNQYLTPFLDKYLDDELEANKKRVDFHDSDEEYTTYVSGFEWYQTHNFYTFDAINNMIKDIKDTMEALSSGRKNEYSDKLKEKRGFAVNKLIYSKYMTEEEIEEYNANRPTEDDAEPEVIIDFYSRFIYRMEYIMKVGEENGYNLISFMGP